MFILINNGSSIYIGGIMTDFYNEIEKWMQSSPNRTPSLLAKKSGVGESTIRRILQREVKPNFETILNILNITSELSEIKHIINNEFPDIGRVMSSVFNNNNKTKVLPDELEKIAQTYEGTLIFCLAGGRRKTKYDDVVKLLGKKGEKVLNNLIDLNAIKIENNYVTSNIEIVLNSETLKSIAVNLLHQFDMDKIGKSPTALIAESETLTNEAILEINKIIWNAYEQISKIKNDHNNTGEIPMYYLMALNTI